MTVLAALHRRLMQARVIALARTVAARMAVYATRMEQHLAKLGEQRHGTLARLRHRGKAFRRLQGLGSRFGSAQRCAKRRKSGSQRDGRHELLRPASGFYG